MRTLIALTALAVAPYAAAADDQQAVRDTITDYVMGFYERDPDRVQSSIHPDLAKRWVASEFWGQPYEWLEPITYEEMRPLAIYFNARGEFDPATARKDIEIFEVSDSVATAKLTGAIWYDYFHLAKIKDQWTVVNVLWGQVDPDTGKAPEGTAEDEAALRAVGRQFIDGFYQSKPELVRPTLHPTLSKHSVGPGRHGIEQLRPITYEQLINNSTDWNNYNNVDPRTARFEFEIYDRTHNSASAKLIGEGWFDYLHLAKIEGEWTIANCVWDSIEDMAGA